MTTFDALHDMGDPVGAARQVRKALAPDGTWLLVEPCRRPSRGQPQPGGAAVLQRLDVSLRSQQLSQPGGYALGAQVGEAAIRRVVTEAGFTQFRAAETPFNLVYAVRP